MRQRSVRRPDGPGDDAPGYQNPDTIGPAGPVDPALTVLAVQSPDGRPIAVLANYSMHYFGAPAVSADYFGAFCGEAGAAIGAAEAKPPFVAMMSQGTSGDQHWMDYSQPKQGDRLDAYAGELAQIARRGLPEDRYHDWVPLAMAEKTLRLAARRRTRSGWRGRTTIVAKMKGVQPKIAAGGLRTGAGLARRENPSAS